MVYGAEEQKKTIQSRIEALRGAADQIKRIKKLVQSFDGKTYNKRFDEALAGLSGENFRIYGSNSYGWYYIHYTPRNTYKNDVTILTGYSCRAENKISEDHQKEDFIIFDSNKRIKAAAMIEGLNRKYAELLKEAYDLEECFRNIDQTLDQIQKAKAVLSGITAALPSIIIDTYGIKRYY